MAVKITYQPEELEIIRGSSFKKDFIFLDENENLIDMADYQFRWVIKDLKQIQDPDIKAIAEGYGDVENSTVKIRIDTLTTSKFPITKKPAVLSLKVFNKLLGTSKIFNYKLSITDTAIKSIY